VVGFEQACSSLTGPGVVNFPVRRGLSPGVARPGDREATTAQIGTTMPSSTFSRTLLLAGLTVVLGLGLSGCGRSVTLGQPQAPGAAGSGGPSSGEVSVGAGDVSVGAGDSGVTVDGGGVKVSAGGASTIGSGQDLMVVSIGSVSADDATEQAVADAFARFWRLNWQAAHDRLVDVKQLGKVASGQAAGAVTDYTRAPGTHVVGQIATDVVDVTIDADDATLTACSTAQIKDVGAGGKVTGGLNGTFEQDVVLRRVGGSWKVTSLTIGHSSCG
jgi:hypothetical protein